MGKIYVTDLEQPKSAFAFVGCFGFYAGELNRELISNKPDGFQFIWQKIKIEYMFDIEAVK